MRFLFLLAGCLLTIFQTEAQTATLFNRLQTPLSPSESRYNTFVSDMEVKWQQQLYKNPAFYELKHTYDDLADTGKYRSILATGYAAGNLDGDFLPYEGNAFEDFRITGSGEYSIASAGTIFGTAQYAREEHQHIGWNATRYAELYQPYISTDSVGGDFHFEDYQIEGGYSFRLNELFLGVYAAFHGEQAHRKSDPRVLNNTTWLSLGLGAGRLFNKHLVMLQAGFERNKQHITMRYWRPGQQDRFFIGYGFGLYDVRLSGVLFGYSRMYYMNEGNATVTYQSPVDKPFILSAALGYRYDYVKTEESDIRDLYASRTHRLHPVIRLKWQPASPVSLTLLLENNTDKRRGYENIFEQYLVDEANNIYDFRLIDTQQKYSSSKSESLIQLKASYRINPFHSLELTGGAALFTREEKYKEENYHVKNGTVSPHIGLGYKMKLKKSEADISCLFIKQLTTDNQYDVAMKNTNIEHLDFQHTFAPYAYYNSTFTSVQLAATYVYHLKKFGIGANLKLMNKAGNRDKEAVYTQDIGFASSAPMITPTPDKHDEIWGSGSLFFVF
ncbi:hypothetical protein NBH15_06910 [Parabacteroides sp. W1-Q-101]|uniref:DUF6850 family outer membrane beta-barrel protein n=1 Tax=Parabacteroides TaxID=375288 RepID=UPI00202DBCF2|nr:MULTISPECIES: DUF6850 family outer membrane beta-barrel protein [Parabacteroides]MCM0718006.1 hypothetical protein [Parabacteroides sp. W1-Q-101]